MDMGRGTEIDFQQLFWKAHNKADNVHVTDQSLDCRLATGFSKVERYDTSVAVVYIHPSLLDYLKLVHCADISIGGGTLGHLWGAHIVQTTSLSPEAVLATDMEASHPVLFSLQGAIVKGTRVRGDWEGEAVKILPKVTSTPDVHPRFAGLELD